MSGHSRMALCAALATVLAATALLPLVDPVTWLLQAAALVLVQTAVGVAGRRVPLPRLATVAAQALVSLMLLTFFFAGSYAIAGVIPGPQALNELGRLLEAGADDVNTFAIPAPLSKGIRLMLVGGVLVIGLLVDAVAVTYRSAAPAGLPLLALYSVAAGLSDGGAGWLWFLLAAAGYLLLLLAEGRDRLARWGKVFTGAPRQPGGYSAAAEGTAAPVRTGRRIGAVALGIALVAPLGMPALDGGLLDPKGGGEGSGPGGGGTISAVNPVVSLQNNLNQTEDREVLTYRTDGAQSQPLYLRIVTLDRFDGAAWKPEVRRVEEVPSPFPTPPGLAAGVRSVELHTRVRAADGYAQGWLPMPYPASNLRIEGRWRFEPVGRNVVGDHGENTSGKTYQVSSLAVQPTPYELAEAGEPPAEIMREFTKVPASLPSIVERTARAVTKDTRNDYEAAVRLQDWFATDGGFRYDTKVKAGSGPGAIARFLRDREGFCVHFSYSMAAMARTLGIPARVAVGFTPGSPQSDGSMSVSLRDAHAWPELYFEGVGWTRFEPTPARGSIPDYARSEAPDSTPTSPAEPTPSASEDITAPRPDTDECPPGARRSGSCGDDPLPVAQDDAEAPWYEHVDLIALIALGVLVVLALPLLPMAWRLRNRSLRLLPVHGPPALAGVGTLRVWEEVQDSAWDYGIPPDPSLTPRGSAQRIVHGLGLDGPDAAAVHRVAGAVEQTLYAPRPQPAPALGAEARRIVVALGRQAGRGARMRALFLPRSNVRLVRAFAEKRRGAAERIRGSLPTGRPRLRLRR